MGRGLADGCVGAMAKKPFRGVELPPNWDRSPRGSIVRRRTVTFTSIMPMIERCDCSGW